MADKYPGIPAISQRIDPATATVLRPVVEILRAFVDGNLPQNGLIKGLQRMGVADGNGNFHLPPSAIAYDNTPPPAPTGLEAAGAIANVILSWDQAPENVRHRISHTEIWRAETDDISIAQMVGQARGQVYVDPIGSAAVRYYWIRYASPAQTNPPISGPFNAQAGTRGETSTDPGLLIDLLVKAGNNTFLYRQEDPNLVIDGVPIPVGVYMNAAFIRRLSVTNAMIANAAIDNAKIANLDAGKITTGLLSAERIDVESIKAAFGEFTEANIGNASIGWLKLYGDMYSDNWYSSGGAQGWYISRNGNATFNNVTVRGNIYADNLYGRVVDAGNMKPNSVTDNLYHENIWPGGYGNGQMQNTGHFAQSSFVLEYDSFCMIFAEMLYGQVYFECYITSQPLGGVGYPATQESILKMWIVAGAFAGTDGNPYTYDKNYSATPKQMVLLPAGTYWFNSGTNTDGNSNSGAAACRLLVFKR